MSRSETRVGCLVLWKTKLMGQVAEPPAMLCTRRARAATGHTGPPMASWCTTAPFVPFLVLAMQMVALSAVRRVLSGELW